MGRKALLVTILMSGAALLLVAQSPQQESLGDFARQVREQHDKDTKKATKVFTNDNLPAPKPGEAVTAPPGPPANSSTAPSTSSEPGNPPSSQETGGNPPESPEGKVKTREYWQAKFKAARQDLAKAKELQQLSEDELNLLQIQQVRETDPNAKTDLNNRVQAKQSEVDTNKATTQAAQKVLDDLQQEFNDSGAPEDWSKTD